MSTIVDVQPVVTEIVIHERVATNEFRIIEIHENIVDRYVRAEIEFGPFQNIPYGDGTRQVGSSRRGFSVWSGAEYDTIRDTWKNLDLITKIKQILEEENGSV